VTDPPRVAVSGVEALGPASEAAKVGSKVLQLGDPPVEFVGPRPDQLEDMPARHLAPVPQGHDLPDLAQGQTDSLGGPHEGQTVEGAFVVDAVTGR
jgi:hypothetical protein